MRSRWFVWLWLIVLGATGSAMQRAEAPLPGDQFVGTWTGTWEGAGSSGGFELTLEKDKAGAIGGRVEVTGEPAYKVTLQSVSFEGPKMTAKYDFPADAAAQVILVASFEGSAAKGTWSLREKATDNEAIGGTWTVSRKP